MMRWPRNALLTTHITVSVGWAGALAAFLAHALVSVLSRDQGIVYAAGLAMAVAAWFVILPLAVATLLTGIVQGLGSPWGLFRHYWVLAKLVLTVFATVILLLKLGVITAVADATRADLDLSGLRQSLLVHAAGGLVVLLTAVCLAVYKPRGTTPFGSQGAAVPLAAGWKYAFWIGAALLVLLLVAMLLGGEHGPTAHMPSAR